MPPKVFSPRWQVFHTHKRGNAPAEYEDAFAGDSSTARFAVADGASESSFAATWASLLVEGFLAAKGRPWRDLEWLAPARQRWAAEVDDKPLPWYAEEKREQGAYATLLGLAFALVRKKGTGTVSETVPVPFFAWRALAVGDSCLFRIRRGKMRQSFPLARSSEFGNTPALLGSRGRAADTPQALRRARGNGQPGDRFLLMTDALAEWMLRRSEEGHRPEEDIARLLVETDPRNAFPGWVEDRRNQQGLHNDDVTLAIIDLGSESSP